MTKYEEILNSVKEDRYSTDDWENHPIEYNHEIAGIEKDPIINIGDLSFNVNDMDDMNLQELVSIKSKLEELKPLVRHMSGYEDNDEDGSTTYWNYYVDRRDMSKNIPYLSFNYLRHVMNHISGKEREMRVEMMNRGAKSMIPILEKYLQIHRERNPSLHPKWLTLKFHEVRYGDIIIEPIIDIKLLLESGDRLQVAKKTNNIIADIWNKLVTGSRHGGGYRKGDGTSPPNLRLTYVNYEGWKEYMKNVVNKQIKPEIKNLPGAKRCVHSIVFRYRKNLNDIEIQIHPRYRSECSNRYWSNFSTYDFEVEMRKILEKYGWKRSINYSDGTWRD